MTSAQLVSLTVGGALLSALVAAVYMASRRADRRAERGAKSGPELSALPAAPAGPDQHTHPLPRSARVVLIVYAFALFIFGAALFVMAEHRDDVIGREFDRRTAARDATDARLRAELRIKEQRTLDAVCTLLISGDLGPSPNITALADQLECSR